MKTVRVAPTFAFLLTMRLLSGGVAGQPEKSDISADALFKAGKFAEAGELYTQSLAQAPTDFMAAVRLGDIALLSNRLDDAQKWLEKALAIKPDAIDAKILLAEVFYRRDDFQQAVPLLRAASQEHTAEMANYSTLYFPKLASFEGLTPYEVQGQEENIRLKFVKTDPLPLVRVRVNGGEEAIFFVDTGGAEVIVDTEFARELGIKQFGSVEGTFAGGQKTPVRQGRIDSLTLGGWVIKNVPVQMLNTRAFSEGLGVKQVDGCIGTVLLYHFLSTIDYPNGELVLRRKTAQNLSRLEASQSGKNVAVPFWMAGDHFMVAWGRVNTLPPSLFFVDTGLAGAGVNLAEAVIKEADIKLQYDRATQGVGGAGKFKSIPYRVPELFLGDIKGENVAGVFDGPLSIGSGLGFDLVAVIGHEFFRRYAVTFDFTGMRIILN